MQHWFEVSFCWFMFSTLHVHICVTKERNYLECQCWVKGKRKSICMTYAHEKSTSLYYLEIRAYKKLLSEICFDEKVLYYTVYHIYFIVTKKSIQNSCMLFTTAMIIFIHFKFWETEKLYDCGFIRSCGHIFLLVMYVFVTSRSRFFFFFPETWISLTSMVVQNQVLVVVSCGHGVELHSHLHTLTYFKSPRGWSHWERSEIVYYMMKLKNILEDMLGCNSALCSGRKDWNFYLNKCISLLGIKYYYYITN